MPAMSFDSLDFAPPQVCRLLQPHLVKGTNGDMTATISRRCLASFLFIISAGFVLHIFAQKPRVPPGGHLAIVADERLAALRKLPDPAARLIRRLSRGRFVSIRGSSRTRDGLTFYQVAINRRTSGWLQSV